MSLSVLKWDGDAPAGAATTSHDSTTFNASPSDPYLQKTGAGNDSVTLNSFGKYQIDVFGDVQSYKPKSFPLLTILSNLGGAPINAPMITWIDEYEGDMWADIKIDDLRESTRNSATGYYGGRLAFEEVSAIPSDGVDLSLGDSALTELALASGNILRLGFDTGSDYIRGKKEEVIRKITNLLDVAGDYTLTTADLGDSDTWYKYKYTAGTSRQVYMCFHDLGIKCGTTYYQKQEVIVGIDAFWFNIDYSEFVIDLDFDFSNISDLLDSTYSNNTVLLEEVSTGSGTAFSSDYTGYYTRLSRMALIGNVYDVPSAVAEGANFEDGGNYIYGQDSYMNYTQIFRSKKYGITGTRQATQVRFRDDFQLSRARHMTKYKQQISSALLFGRQSITYDATTGMPKRTMSGFFDFELFPIRYMRKPIPAISSAAPVGNLLATWLDELAYSLNAYKEGQTEANTLLASREVMKLLDDWITYVSTMRGNILGFTAESAPPSAATLGLGVTEFKTRYGMLRFIHEPALDYMPTFPYSTESATAGSARGGAPVHLFSSGINPRKMILSIDKAYAQFPTLRPDQIHGNIQAVGQDMFQEAIRGEHSMKLRFPMNHAVIDVSD